MSTMQRNRVLNPLLAFVGTTIAMGLLGVLGALTWAYYPVVLHSGLTPSINMIADRAQVLTLPCLILGAVMGLIAAFVVSEREGHGFGWRQWGRPI